MDYVELMEENSTLKLLIKDILEILPSEQQNWVMETLSDSDIDLD